MEISVLSSVRDLPPREFPHRLLFHAQSDGIAQRLDQLFERVQASAGTEQQTFATLQQLDRTQHILSLELTPAFRLAVPPEPPPRFEARFQAWLEQSLSLVLLPDGTIVDPQRRTLYAPGEPPDPQAAPPQAAEAIKRRERTQARLGELTIPSYLPLVISERQFNPRQEREIAQRCLALLIVALQAECARCGEPIPSQQLAQMRPLGIEQLTPQEQAYLNNPDPKADLAFGWRIESLLTLLWSLGLQELPPPSELCDVARVVDSVLNSQESDLISAARLRDPMVLLDTLDLVFCQHWLLRQAESKRTIAAPQLFQGVSPLQVEPGVIYERHYALSWLTRSESSPWDDIATPLGPST